MLAAEELGNKEGSPVVMVHGFTQTRRSWRPIAERLAPDHHVTLVDAPGHGGSAEVRADLWQGAALLGQRGGTAAYVGYSMGARLCLHLALLHPDLVTRLVLVGVHPGISGADADADGSGDARTETESEIRRARRAQDEGRARRLEADGVAGFVDWWLGQPLFSTLDPVHAGRDDRLTNTVAGLASSLRLAGTGRQEPLWDRLGSLAMPVLLVAGQRDAKFAELGRRAAAAIGERARLVLIPGAGHACHLEAPEAFAAVVADFLRPDH